MILEDMIYYFRKHPVRTSLATFVTGFLIAGLLAMIPKTVAPPVVFNIFIPLVQFLLIAPGLLLFCAPGPTLIRIYAYVSFAALTLFGTALFAAENMLWAAILTAIFSLAAYILLRDALDRFCFALQLRLPVVARDFWHMHEMIRHQKDDPDSLRTLFSAIDESELLFDRSWESGEAFCISAMDVREDLPLVGVFLQFKPQPLDDALISRLDRVVDAASLSTHARLFGLSVHAPSGTAQVMFYVEPGRERKAIRLLKKLIARNGFTGDAVPLTNIARLAAEKSLTPSEEAMETGILAARSGMFTRLDMDMTAVQTVYMQFVFDSREKAMSYMDAHREKRFVDMGYWNQERGLYMVVIAVECDLRVESMARHVVPVRESGATLLDVETELDGLYRSEEDGEDRN